jgi:hypothetical protein
MTILPTQVLTVRLPGSLMEAAQQAASQQGIPVSEVVRDALRAHLELDPARSRHATMLYEIAKNRSLLLRFMDTQLDTGEVEKMLALAETDATEYTCEKIG